MHTLVILQNDAKLHKAVKAFPLKFPEAQGKIHYKLHVYDEQDPLQRDWLEEPRKWLGASFVTRPSKITKSIKAFARQILSTDLLVDIVEMQVIFMFHQTAAQEAADITSALNRLSTDAAWRDLPYQYGRALNVKRVYLMSCESGMDQTTTDPRLQTYINQARNMRTAAAAAFRCEKAPPPSNPKEYWDPYIFTFSTGNAVTGALRMHPNFAEFVETPSWHIDANGNISQIPGTKDVENPSAGSIHVYEGTTFKKSISVASGEKVDILKSPPAIP